MRAFLPLFAIATVGLASATAAQSPAPRPPAFATCAGCHATEPGKTVFGPSLAGVASRKAGSLPGYDYSLAMKKAKHSWNAATLDRWLTSPQRMVAGTKMPFLGISDAATRKAVVDYLLTLK